MPPRLRTILHAVCKVSVIVFLCGYIKKMIKKVTKKCGNFNEVSGLLLLIFQMCWDEAFCILHFCFHKLCGLRSKHGACRLCAFVIFGGLIFFVGVGCLWFLTRIKLVPSSKDITVFKESREHFETQRIEKYPSGIQYSLFEIYRYQGEDVQMQCSYSLAWLTYESPNILPLVVWTKDGKQLQPRPRYSVHEDVKRFKSGLDRNNVTLYIVKGTLTISALESTDFGNYTCHGVDLRIINKFAEYCTGIQILKDLNNCLASESRTEFMDQFKLLEVPPRKITVYVPLKSIFVFQATFWHELESDEDVSVEYLINEQSASNGVCNGLFGGCSLPFLTYLVLTYHYSLLPPLVEKNWFPEQLPVKAKAFRYYACVCAKSYGYHRVQYSRQIYNSAKRRYERVYAVHPDEFVVQQTEQDKLFQTENHFKQNYTYADNAKQIETVLWLLKVGIILVALLIFQILFFTFQLRQLLQQTLADRLKQ